MRFQVSLACRSAGAVALPPFPCSSPATLPSMIHVGVAASRPRPPLTSVQRLPKRDPFMVVESLGFCVREPVPDREEVGVDRFSPNDSAGVAVHLTESKKRGRCSTYGCREVHVALAAGSVRVSVQYPM